MKENPDNQANKAARRRVHPGNHPQAKRMKENNMPVVQNKAKAEAAAKTNKITGLER